jgi:hypothetical protein
MRRALTLASLLFLSFLASTAHAQGSQREAVTPWAPEDSQNLSRSSDEKTLADGLYMAGRFVATYGLNYSTVTVNLDYIYNDSYIYTTGTLRLSYWATTSYPARAAGFTGYRLATFATLNPLPPRYYYHGIVRTSAMSVPPNGTYWLILALEEYDPSNCSDPSGYCLVDSFISDQQRTFGPTGYPLTVSKAGNGVGTVMSSPAGISCGSSCSASYLSGTTVTLTASPSAGSSFVGWSGACSGTATCTVSMTAARGVIATFNTTISSAALAAMVTHYYNAILRRAPDSGGHVYWQNEALRIVSLGGNVNEAWFSMAMSFFTSPEYVALNRNDLGFVTDLYLTFFDRAPDSGGMTYWMSQLGAGLPREVLLAQFMFSPEFVSYTQARFGNTSARAEVDTVMDFYRGVLSRLPDSPGFVYWVQRFRTAQCQGSAALIAEVEAISSAYTNSAEYLGRNRSIAQFVGDMYNAFLRRGGDLAGVQYWIQQVQSGARTRENVRQQFLASPEFTARVNAVVQQGCFF